MRLGATTATILLTLLAASSSAAGAASLQQIGSFQEPIYVTSDPGNPNRLFVVERRGAIERVEGGTTALFADLRSQVGCSAGCVGERGLLSIALAPDFDSTGRLYVDYAANGDGTIHVDELTAAADRLSAPASSLRPLLAIPHGSASNHNGGQLQFGPEGNLFISTGDGGGSNDQFHNAQDLTSPLGKILRIRPDPGGPSPFYTVPAENPFAGIGGDYTPIWSDGLRNPFRFSFDRLSGELTIADVGQGAREEVDAAPAPTLGRGANYGWNCREGLVAGPASDPQCAGPSRLFVDPVFDYEHSPDPDAPGADRCAIIGGYVVRDRSLEGLYGRYVYGDLCVGLIRSLDLASPFASDRSEGLKVPNLNSFGEDSCGRVYAVSGSGEVLRLVGAMPAVCPGPGGATPRAKTQIRVHAARKVVRRGHRARIRVTVSPCPGREGDRLDYFLGRNLSGFTHLSHRCAAHLRPRIRHRTSFRAKIAGNAAYLPAHSRRLVIRLRRPRAGH